jgi:hypothetical protein
MSDEWDSVRKIIGKQVKEGDRKPDKKFKDGAKYRPMKITERKKTDIAQASQYVAVKSIKPTKDRVTIARYLAKERGLAEDLLLNHFFLLNCVPVESLSTILDLSPQKIRNLCTAEYYAGELVKKPVLDSIKMWRLFDEQGNPIENTGIEGVKVNEKLFRFIKKQMDL